MSELTPIIKYEGPGVQKKEWTKRGIDILNNLEKLNPNLAVRSTTRHYPDGSVIVAQTIQNDIMRVDSLDIKVPVSGGRALELFTEVLAPILVFDNKEYTQLFIQVKNLADRTDYPETGTDIAETYKPYGLVTDTVNVASLKPIAAAGYSIDFVQTSELTVDDYASDPENTCEVGAPLGGECVDSSLYNTCAGLTFYLDWFTAEIYFPPGGVYTYTYEYGYINTWTLAILDSDWNVMGTPTDLPAGFSYEYLIEGETVVTHSTAIGGWDYSDPAGSDPPYEYISGRGYFATCEDEGAHAVDTNTVTETGSIPDTFIGCSAVVVGAEGYEDYGTWGVIYGIVDSGTLVIAVYLALYDKDTGFRQYKLEDANYTGISEVDDIQGLFCYGKVDIFDFGGKPYFVVSYIGLGGGGGA